MTPAEQLDREALLALNAAQAAKIAAVTDLANSRGRCGWTVSADEIRNALKAAA